jgi:hypothetical protein
VRDTHANRSIHGWSSNGGLIGDSTTDDGPHDEGCRREPPPVVLPVAATVFPISPMPVVVAPVATPFETRTFDSALTTRVVKAAAFKSASIIITTKLYLLQIDD